MCDPNKSKGKGKDGRPGYLEVHVNAQFSEMPATECIGAGRLEGWFQTPAWMVEGRGWGYIKSYCFEGDLFYHTSRSPLLRNINYQKKDPVTFEVVEYNGHAEAVKLLLPRQVTEMENGREEDKWEKAKPDPTDLVGQRIEGFVKSQWQLVEKQKWGFVASEHFKGMVFFHITESPDLQGVHFEREDLVEFDIYLGGKSGKETRARNVNYLGTGKRIVIAPKRLTEKKQAQKEAWKRNWRKGHPPDWECKNCMFTNFGRNKICRKCEIGTRPPREEWPPEEDDYDDNTAPQMHPGDWRCSKCGELNFSNRSKCRLCGADKPLFQVDWSDWTAEGGSGQGSKKEEASWQEWQQWGEASDWGAASGSSATAQAPGAKPALPKPANVHQAKVAETLFGKLAPDGDKKAQISLCMGAFQDLIQATVPDGENTEIVEKVKSLIAEVNEVLKEDKSAKHAFAMQISKHPWFLTVGHEVRYRPSANLIEISQVQGAHLSKGKGKGKDGKDGKGGWPQPPPAPSPAAQTSWSGLKRTAEQAGLRAL